MDNNIHLPVFGSLDEMLAMDLSLDGQRLIRCAELTIEKQSEEFKGGNIMLFNQKIKLEDIQTLKTTLIEEYPDKRFFITHLADKERYNKLS